MKTETETELLHRLHVMHVTRLNCTVAWAPHPSSAAKVNLLRSFGAVLVQGQDHGINTVHMDGLLQLRPKHFEAQVWHSQSAMK
jgi:hypothetical protein